MKFIAASLRYRFPQKASQIDFSQFTIDVIDEHLHIFVGLCSFASSPRRNNIEWEAVLGL